MGQLVHDLRCRASSDHHDPRIFHAAAHGHLGDGHDRIRIRAEALIEKLHRISSRCRHREPQREHAQQCAVRELGLFDTIKRPSDPREVVCFFGPDFESFLSALDSLAYNNPRAADDEIRRHSQRDVIVGKVAVEFTEQAVFIEIPALVGVVDDDLRIPERHRVSAISVAAAHGPCGSPLRLGRRLH